jgi:plasmid stability protein
MNLTINLPDEDVQALEVRATARGVSAEQSRYVSVITLAEIQKGIGHGSPVAFFP